MKAKRNIQCKLMQRNAQEIQLRCMKNCVYHLRTSDEYRSMLISLKRNSNALDGSSKTSQIQQNGFVREALLNKSFQVSSE